MSRNHSEDSYQDVYETSSKRKREPEPNHEVRKQLPTYFSKTEGRKTYAQQQQQQHHHRRPRPQFINCPRCDFSNPKFFANITYLTETSQFIIAYADGNLDMRKQEGYNGPFTQQIYQCCNTRKNCDKKLFAFVQDFDGRVLNSRSTRTIPNII